MCEENITGCKKYNIISLYLGYIVMSTRGTTFVASHLEAVYAGQVKSTAANQFVLRVKSCASA